MDGLWIVTSSAGPERDLARPTREQPLWDEHATFIDRLVDDGFIVLGGPLPDTAGAVLVVRGPDEAAVRARLARDPWYLGGILQLESVRRWEVFIDRRAGIASLIAPRA